MTDVKTISRRALVKAGFGAMAAPAVLRRVTKLCDSVTPSSA